MKKIEVIVRTTEDNFPPQEKVILKFTEQTVPPAENNAVLSYPGLEIHQSIIGYSKMGKKCT